MSAQDYIYCYQGKGLRISGDTSVVGKRYYPLFPVTIGSQKWMGKNLSIDDGQGGIYTQTVNYGQGEVVEYYYTWEAAVRVAGTVEGWHLPTASEWDTLITYSGGSEIAGINLKSTYGWNSDGNGYDLYGFAAFPAGLWRSNTFINSGNAALFWTATEYSVAWSYYRAMGTDSSMTAGQINKTYGYSVRLIKDA